MILYCRQRFSPEATIILLKIYPVHVSVNSVDSTLNIQRQGKLEGIDY